MSEVHRFSVVKMLSEAGNKISYDPHGPEIVMAKDYDALAAKLAMAEDAAAKGDAARQQCGGMEMEIEELRAEAQTLREEVAEYEALCNRQAELLSQSIVAIRGPEPELTRWGYADLPLRVKTIVEEVSALRARVVVVPNRLPRSSDIASIHQHSIGWNACLDELARLNDMTVSEGLLRRVCAEQPATCCMDDEMSWRRDRDSALIELRALLSEQE